MTDREIIKEARDLIVMCSLLDKSGQCNEMADKMDKQLSIPVVMDRLPESDYIRQQAQQMDEKEFDQWWWETVYKGN